MNDYKVVFTPPSAGAPASILSNGHVELPDSSPFKGLKLTGFTVWAGKGKDPSPYVTLPSRRTGAGFYDILRAVEDGAVDPSTRAKAFILEAYLTQEALKATAAAPVEKAA